MAELPVNELPPLLSMPEAPIDDELAELSERVLGHRYLPFPATTLPEEWTIEKVREALRLHDQGFFWHTMRLVRVITKDPRVMSALLQRIMITLPLLVSPSPARGGRGVSATAADECRQMFAPRSAAIPVGVRRKIREDLIFAGVAIFQNIWTPRPDGTRWDLRIEHWPLEYAFWNASINRYQVITTEGLLTIEHGHGKWGIIEQFGPRSWMLGSVRALAMPWADRTYAIRYRSQHAAAHGSPIPIGEMPKGTPINSPEGKLYQRLIQTMLNQRVAGVQPAGATTKYLEPMSNAWQVFDSIVRNSDEDIALAILGQDGTAKKGTFYTSPIFGGMRLDLTELDHVTFELGTQTGSVNVWATINFGAEFIPTVAHQIPDPEQDSRLAAYALRHDAFTRAILAYEQAGFEVDDAFAAALAVKYGIDDVPLPKKGEAPKPVAPALPQQEDPGEVDDSEGDSGDDAGGDGGGGGD